jgi:hypothetical protein
MQSSDRNIHKSFPIETLMHTNTSSKTIHNIKMYTHKNNYIHAHAMLMRSGLRSPMFCLRAGLRSPVLGLGPQCFVCVPGLGPRFWA